MVNSADHPGQPIPRRNRTRSDAGTESDAGHGNTSSRKPRPRNGGTGFRYSVSNSGHRSPGTGNSRTAAGNDGSPEQHTARRPAAFNQSEFAEYDNSAGHDRPNASAGYDDSKCYDPAAAVTRA